VTITAEDLPRLNGTAGEVAAHLNAAADMAGRSADAAKAIPPSHAAAAGSASAAAVAYAAAANAITNAATDPAPAAAGGSAMGLAKAAAPKAFRGGAATAVAYVLWTVAAATVWKHTFSSGKLAALIAATAVVLTGVLSAWRARSQASKAAAGGGTTAAGAP